MPKSRLGLIVQHENGSLVSDHYGNVIVFNNPADASQFMLKGSRWHNAYRYSKPRTSRAQTEETWAGETS